MNSLKRLSLIGLSVAGLLSTPLMTGTVWAQESGSGKSKLETVFLTVTQEQMAAIMRDEGYAVDTDSGKIVWKIDGMKALMLLGNDGESVQFYAAFADGNATLKKVNEWNKTKRYSRSYLDNDDDPCLELDLDLAGGVTLERIKDYLKTCRLSYQSWVTEVVK